MGVRRERERGQAVGPFMATCASRLEARGLRTAGLVLLVLVAACRVSDGLYGTQDAALDARADAEPFEPDAASEDASLEDASLADAASDAGRVEPTQLRGTSLSPGATVMSSARFRLSTGLSTGNAALPSRSPRFRLEPAALRAP